MTDVTESASKYLNISSSLLPAGLLNSPEVRNSNIVDIFNDTEKFDESKWEEGLDLLVGKLVTTDPQPQQQKLVTTDPQPQRLLKFSAAASPPVDRNVSQDLEEVLTKEAGNELFYKALLKLLILTINNPHVLNDVTKSQGILHFLSMLITKGSFSVIVQAIVSKLLRCYEELTKTSKVKEFTYPPFQRGLPFFPEYGCHITFAIPGATLTPALQSQCQTLLQSLTDRCNEINVPNKETTVDFNVGFDPTIWVQWLKGTGLLPTKPITDAIHDLSPENNFIIKHQKLTQSEIHMWFFIKGSTIENCTVLVKEVKKFCTENSIVPTVSESFQKNNGKLFGGYFLDGISNAVDAMSLEREVLLTGISHTSAQSNCDGGTFAFLQTFNFDNTIFEESSNPAKESMIGRDGTHSETLARIQERAHVKRARIIRPDDGTNHEFLRQALPVMDPVTYQTTGLFFTAFSKTTKKFFQVFERMFGEPGSTFTHDLLLTHIQGIAGAIMYCPSADELKVVPKFTDGSMYPSIPFWMKYKSSNPLLFYNHIQYLYVMSTNQYAEGDPPCKRVLHLLSIAFQRWHSTWFHKFDVPRMPHLRSFLTSAELSEYSSWSIPFRKGYSYKKMLGSVLTSNETFRADDGNYYGISEKFGTFRIYPKELIVGVTDRLSIGSGKEVMPYLLESEQDLSWNLALTEAGNMGHIVPRHKYILDLGVEGMLNTLRTKLKQPDLKDDQKDFYKSAIQAYEGVKLYLLRYALLADTVALTLDPETTTAEDRENLRDVARRMNFLAYNKPASFQDAAQLIFTMHCCLHLVGQAVSVGRLDQLLQPYYVEDISKGTLTADKAQEIIDCFFIKFDEHVVLSSYNFPYGHVTYGSSVVTGRGGPFSSGDSLNQWIQQVTLGGYTPDGKDACNDVTMMCLNAARRLPLNAPCVSLRLTPLTPQKVKLAAAKSLLSGGAHPLLYHDDKIVEGMLTALKESFVRSNLPLPLDLEEVARDYCADGCFEPLYAGRTEFFFSYIFLLKAIIYTINSGADYQHAGPLDLAGPAVSFRTDLAEDIKLFENFQEIFLIHLRRMVQDTFSLILSNYANTWKICPSPLLSCLIEGCVDSGYDMSNGGSRFHILTPMYVGFTNAVNSLYNVKKMVYGRNNTTTLKELKMALINNWGYSMVEPFFDTVSVSDIHTDLWAQKYQAMREHALTLPKFGTTTADAEVNDIAKWLAQQMNEIAYDALYNSPVTTLYRNLQNKFATEGKPSIVFQVMAGAGTFESYSSVGSICAATPDGRLSGQPTASDCSPQPYPQDKDVPASAPMDIIDTLVPYTDPQFNISIPNGCEIDIPIEENFPLDKLLQFIDSFIQGKTGSNVISVTCVDLKTLAQAVKEPQKFDLIRNRMGGWSNFFVAMFPEHQKQHQRRVYFGPPK